MAVTSCLCWSDALISHSPQVNKLFRNLWTAPIVWVWYSFPGIQLMSDATKPGEPDPKAPISFANRLTVSSVSSQGTADFTPPTGAKSPSSSQATGDFTLSSSGATADFSSPPNGNAETMRVDSKSRKCRFSAARRSANRASFPVRETRRRELRPARRNFRVAFRRSPSPPDPRRRKAIDSRDFGRDGAIHKRAVGHEVG